jgi:hypothetical protein
MEKDFELFLTIAPLLKDILQEDVSVTVTDKSTILYYSPSKAINFQLKAGDKLNKHEEAMNKTLQDGKIRTSIVPKEVLGVPFKGTVYPIKDSIGNVVGTFCLARSLKKQFSIEEAANSVFNSLQQTNSSIQEISAGSQTLSASMDTIVKSVAFADEKIQETDSILNLIQNISSQSNLLALNAAIEAARAGDAGRGFSVVAGEMKKLSQISSDSAKKISQALIEMKKSIDDIIKEINATSLIAESQAAATQEMTAALEEVTSSSGLLVDACKEL